MKTYSFAYSALTAIPANPVHSVSDTTDIKDFTFSKLVIFFIDISPVIKLITLNIIANRNINIASGIDGAAVALVSAQYTKYLPTIIISKTFGKINVFLMCNKAKRPFLVLRAFLYFINLYASVSYMLEKTL